MEKMVEVCEREGQIEAAGIERQTERDHHIYANDEREMCK